MTVSDRYQMNREHSVLFAKRLVVDSIWKEANLEGIPVTFPETQTIYEGLTVAGLTLNQTKAINNLKHAWEFVLDHLDVPLDLGLVRQLNALVGAEDVILHAGELRQYAVAIGGTTWRPDQPDAATIGETLARVADICPDTERALTYFSTIARGQWFADGNKRTAQLVCNLALIRDGRGVCAIDTAAKETFGKELISFYETGAAAPLHQWLFDHALAGATSPEYTHG